jgi:hypothetical protein
MDNNPIWLNDELGDVANGGDKGKGKGEQPTHKVQKGDNLWDIAKKYNTTVEQIAKWNNIKDVNQIIHVGDVLKVGPKPTQNSKPQQKPKSEKSTQQVNNNNLKKQYGNDVTVELEIYSKTYSSVFGKFSSSETKTINKGKGSLTITTNSDKVKGLSMKVGGVIFDSDGNATIGNDILSGGTTKSGNPILKINIPSGFGFDSNYNTEIEFNYQGWKKGAEKMGRELIKGLENSSPGTGFSPPPWFIYAF